MDLNIINQAILYHRTHKGKQLTFENRNSFLVDIYCDENDYIVVKKATQCGISEWLSVATFNKAIKGRSIFYVLPTDKISSRFVKNRIDRSIDFSSYYKSLIRIKMTKYSESISLKHMAEGSIAFVGSNTETVFTEYPADDLIIDELDQTNQNNIKMAVERLSASEDKNIIKVSNPTYEGFGIDDEFKDTDMKEWHVKCSNCGKDIIPDFFQHVVQDMGENNYIIKDDKWNRELKRDILPICHICNKPYNRKASGKWIPSKKSNKSGYHISKMFSTNVTLIEMVDRFEKGLKNDREFERFYNGDLGIAYTSAGAKIDYGMLDECIEDYTMPKECKDACICGIDVGDRIHVRIDEILFTGKTKAVYINTVHELNDLVYLFKRYNIKMGCIDAMPEKRLSRKICTLHKNFFMVYYTDTAKNDVINLKKKTITVDRTSSLDGVKESLVTQSLMLPKNVRNLAPITNDGVSEYYANMTASTRIFDEDKEKYNWTEGSKPDHYFHAENYKLIAKKLLIAYTK